MNSARIGPNARVLVASLLVLVGAGLTDLRCLAQETAPQTARPGQASSPTPEAAARAKAKEPQLIDGAYTIGNGVTPPTLTHSVDPQFTQEAKRKKIQGLCIVELLIDEQGMPQDIRVKKSIDPELDANAVKAVQKYRFLPSMYKGKPVPVRISIEVNYRINK